MKAVSHASLALALVAGGILLGYGIFSRADGTIPGNRPGATGSERPDRQRIPPASTASADHRNLAGLRASRERNLRAGTDLQRAMERLDVAALKALVLEQWSLHKRPATPEELAARRQVANDAAKELYRREGVAALEWGDGLAKESDSSKAIQTTLLGHALGKDPGSTGPWLKKFLAANGQSNIAVFDIFRAGLDGAMERGADEVIRVTEMFKTEGYTPFYGRDFPEDFDFAKLYSTLGDRMSMGGMVPQWVARDPDTAWAAIKTKLDDNPAKGHEDLNAVIAGAIARNGESAGIAWAMERLDELPAGRRESFLRQMDLSGNLSLEGISAVARSLHDDERQILAGGMIKSRGITPRALTVLESMPRDRAVSFLSGDVELIKSYSGPPKGSAAHQAQMEKIRAELQTRLRLTPDEISLIMDKKPAE